MEEKTLVSHFKFGIELYVQDKKTAKKLTGPGSVYIINNTLLLVEFADKRRVSYSTRLVRVVDMYFHNIDPNEDS